MYEGPDIVTANGSPLKVHGTKNTNLKLSGEKYLWKFVVANVAMPILGADFLIANKLSVNLTKKIPICR